MMYSMEQRGQFKDHETNVELQYNNIVAVSSVVFVVAVPLVMSDTRFPTV